MRGEKTSYNQFSAVSISQQQAHTLNLSTPFFLGLFERQTCRALESAGSRTISVIMVTAHFRFDASLNDFLPRHRRHSEISCVCARAATVKHMIEALGVPHTEVTRVLVNGESCGFDRLLHKGDSCAWPVSIPCTRTTLKTRRSPCWRASTAAWCSRATATCSSAALSSTAATCALKAAAQFADVFARFGLQPHARTPHAIPDMRHLSARGLARLALGAHVRRACGSRRQVTCTL